MKNKIICFAVVYCIIFSLFANINVYAQDDDGVILPSGITTEQYEQQMTQLIEESSQPDAAVAAAIANKDKTLSEIISGYSDIENKKMADESTVYEWGSLTKVLTWIGIMQLEEQGKLELSENIQKYLPENFLQKLSYDKPVTVLDLMNHSGGWQDSITNVYTDDPDQVISLSEYVSKYEPPQIFEPGTTVAYSNWGVTLAGYIIEQVSGQTYIDYVNKNIFTPLEMDHTSIDPLREDNQFVREGLMDVKGYTTQGKELKGRYYAPDYPAAGAAGTLHDAVIIMKALLGDGTENIFKDKSTLKKMLTPTKNYIDTDYPELAHGLWYDSYNTETMGHYGNTVQFSTHMTIDPVSGTGALIMTNQAQEMTFNAGIGDIVFGNTDTQNISDKGWQKHNFSKYYECARTIKKGYCSFYGYFNVYRVKQIDNDNIEVNSLFMKLPCERTGDNVYIVSSGHLKGYKVFTETDDEGNVERLATYTFDMNKYSSSRYIVDTMMFIVFAIFCVLSLILLIVSVVGFVKKKERITLLRMEMNAFSALFFVMLLIEMMKLITTAASTDDMIPFIVFYYVYIAAGILFTAVSTVKKQKNKMTIISVLNFVCIAAFIVYWKMLIIV